MSVSPGPEHHNSGQFSYCYNHNLSLLHSSKQSMVLVILVSHGRHVPSPTVAAIVRYCWLPFISKALIINDEDSTHSRPESTTQNCCRHWCSLYPTRSMGREKYSGYNSTACQWLSVRNLWYTFNLISDEISRSLTFDHVSWYKQQSLKRKNLSGL